MPVVVGLVENKNFDISKIRSDFPVLGRTVYGKPLVYLDNAATSQKPRKVIESLTQYYESYNSNVHRGVHALSMEATDKYEEARSKVAKFVGAKNVESIIWTRNATEAINLVANTWARENIHTGDEIVVSQMEHHSNLVPWQRVAHEKGAKLNIIPITSEGTLELGEINTIINSRTKLVSIVHISNSLGTINPVEQLIEKAHKVGAMVLIDGAQSVPHIPVNVGNLDCDFMVFSGHKMLGPTGIGVLYAKPDILEKMEPFLLGGEMVLEVSNEKATWNDLPMKFEAGTPNIADAIALGNAVDYLELVGMENIAKHERQITALALNALSELDVLKIFGPRDVSKRGGVISFYHPEIHPHDIGTFLDRDGVAVRTGHHCTMPLMRILDVPATIRASFYLYNTENEVAVLVESLQRGMGYFSHGTKVF